uniref:Uncharacterized protein n=1 Tax=Plectus sambesii TaxID=2011161 RepID=A0A914VIC1_9BILA
MAINTQGRVICMHKRLNGGVQADTTERHDDEERIEARRGVCRRFATTWRGRWRNRRRQCLTRRSGVEYRRALGQTSQQVPIQLPLAAIDAQPINRSLHSLQSPHLTRLSTVLFIPSNTNVPFVW